jgi:hypothetical protein
MRVTRRENVDDLDITLSGIKMDDVACCKYFGVDIDRYSDLKINIKHK